MTTRQRRLGHILLADCAFTVAIEGAAHAGQIFVQAGVVGASADGSGDPDPSHDQTSGYYWNQSDTVASAAGAVLASRATAWHTKTISFHPCF
jgi:hypothetical protein